MWIDITHTLSEEVAPWPGDPAFMCRYFTTKQENGVANVGEISGSNHIGTHIDTPKHIDDAGITVEQLDIQRLIGDATVLTFLDHQSITMADLKRHDIRGKIILFKTQQKADPKHLPKAITVLTAEAIDYLASCGIEVIGVDVPSVDVLNSETLDNHHRLAQHEIYHIENLCLNAISSGYYRFIGLPIKVRGAEAAYIRAVVAQK
ncbi:cyclase family protein [Staphylococcus sp. 17KM0847]|uniref:cyclase family protein n=1 Tax=Staphylococcus sp. 17KM0847 TaxID=2583989 RepID=UPI0015DC6745|nr:cyclase family protein [Staphylococcus sp. 17KM0847]QLK86800.1 arylformamidase [Staphylococcus sp. 17KM0847]